MDNELKFADSVWHRVVQCVQEAMLMGVDVSDTLRQIRVMVDPIDQATLVLTPEYEAQVRSMHKKLLDQAKEIQAQSTPKFIIPGDGDN